MVGDVGEVCTRSERFENPHPTIRNTNSKLFRPARKPITPVPGARECS
jgi:hypothetical protein